MYLKKTTYIAIDKSIVKENEAYEFPLFVASETENKMYLFKSANTPIIKSDMDKLASIEVLYINEHHRAHYLKYYNSIVKHEEKKYISFEQKATTIYKKASVILATLFANPDAVETYQASKNVVNELVDTVSDDDFDIDAIINIAEHEYSIMTHSINVSIYALSLGAHLKLNKLRLKALCEAALLHDIGKSKINPEIVNKEGELTDEEFEEIKKYPMLGYTIGIKLGIKNQEVLFGIRYHQEKMDGSGYSSGLSGENIPYIARIVAVCDIFDALTSKKSYREPMGAFEALLLMKTKMGKKLDGKVLNNMIEMFK